jgi:hypothetical protein
MGRHAWAYHKATSYERPQMGGHFLDWANQHDVFKTYTDREPVEMPKEIPLPKEDLFSLYDHPFARNKHQTVRDLEDLSRLLLLSCTLTAQTKHPSGTFYYRSAASAGALYPTVAIREPSWGLGIIDRISADSLRAVFS